MTEDTITPTAPRSGRRLLLVLGVVLALALAAGVWAYATGRIFPRGFTVRGVVAVNEADVTRSAGAVCHVSDTYPDIATGTQVVITDGTGKTVAIGALGSGQASDRHDCVFTFTVLGVPGGLGFYGVEVAHRGRVQFAEAQMRSGVALQLGR